MLRRSIKPITRVYSTAVPPSSPSPPPPPPPQISNRERIQLARTSIKDIFDGFITNEESFEPIDTKPILANPHKFVELSTFHRDQVTDEVIKRLARNWKDVPIDTKKMAYFISYGNWGVREDLSDPLFANARPEDLPFTYPSKIRTFNPKASDIVHKLPPVDLMQVNEKRREEFNKITRKLDPMSKIVVYLALLITLCAIWRDKYIGESGLVEEADLESPLLIAERKRQEEVEKLAHLQKVGQIDERKSKKWYYLWLR